MRLIHQKSAISSFLLRFQRYLARQHLAHLHGYDILFMDRWDIYLVFYFIGIIFNHVNRIIGNNSSLQVTNLPIILRKSFQRVSRG